MEQKEVLVEEGIRIGDIFKLLLRKVKFIILAVLIGAVFGGTLAVWTTHDVKYYGTRVEFYVNPKKPTDGTNSDSQYGVYGAYGQHVMDNMIRLLSSESFTELMILNGKDLPEKGVWIDESNPTEVAFEAELNEKIDLATTDLEYLDSFKSELEIKTKERAETYLSYTKATKSLQEEWETLYKANDKLVTVMTFDLDAFLRKIKVAYEADAQASKQYQTLYEVYEERASLDEKLDDIDEEITALQTLCEDAQQVAAVSTDAALQIWRKTAKYKTTLKKYGDALEFSYLNDDETDNANNLARSFVYVEVDVLNDEGFAETLLETVKTVVPTYVEANMTVPSGYTGTNCQRLTRTDDIRRTNDGYTSSQAVKYAILLGLVAAIAVCVVIVLIDRSDKRLRDPDFITKSFNVPVLGIIPTIEELEADLKIMKKLEKKNHTEVK